MQRLRIINKSGAVADFRTDRPDGKPAPYVFNTLYGGGKPETAVFTTQSPGQHGATPHEWLYEPRELELTGYVYGATQAEMYQRMLELNMAISSIRGECRLEYQNDYGMYYINGTAVDPVPYDVRIPINGNYKTVTILFVCHDPMWRPMDGDNTATVAYRSGRFKFPFRFAATFGGGGYRQQIVNIGDQNAPVEITITGPAIKASISNLTTGKRISFLKPVLATQSLYINTTPGQKAVQLRSAVGEPPEDVWGELDYNDAQFALWDLAPGVNDIVYISGDDTVSNAVVTLKWESLLSGV